MKNTTIKTNKKAVDKKPTNRSKKRKAMTTQEYEEMLMEFIKSEFEECI